MFALIGGTANAADETLLEKANAGDAGSQFKLGMMYAKGEGVPRDNVQSLIWCRKAAEQGLAPAQYNVGVAYQLGKGVPPDGAEAVNWFRKAAVQGNAKAQASLGAAYFGSMGVLRDPIESTMWNRKAADQGDSQGQFGLGWAYQFGVGVPRNGAEAVSWYRKAADQGIVPALYSIGEIYETGNGVPKDSSEAAKWLLKAALKGDVQAQANLGERYLRGDGVPKDRTEAVMWLRKAADQGWVRAREVLFNLQNAPTPAPAPLPSAGGPAITDIGHQSKFATMTYAEQSLLIEQIRKQDAESIFQLWISSGRSEHDPVKQQTVGALLGYALRAKAPTAEPIQEIQHFIADNSNSTIERIRLIRVLGQVRTGEALDILIAAATGSPDADLREQVANQIAVAGERGDDGKFHEELSPALERVWSASEDKMLLISAAAAMAEAGAPSGVDMLFRSALAAGTRDEFRASVAKVSLSRVKNPDAIPALSAHLLGSTTTNDETTLASGTLVAIDKPGSVAVVVGWLERTDEYAAPFARVYVLESKRQDSKKLMQLWESALDPAVPFRSEDVREAIRSGFADHQRRARLP